MPANPESTTPVLIKTGVSIPENNDSACYTVQYKNRFLYSKYNPKKNILSAIENIEIKPNTLVLVFSPCLFYGIEELVKKCGAELGKSIFIIAVEAEKELLPQFLAMTVTGNSSRQGVQGAGGIQQPQSVQYAGGVPEPKGFEGATFGKNDRGIEGGGINGVQIFPHEYLTVDGINLFLKNLANSTQQKIPGVALPAPGIIRRAIRLDFSGGVAFNADFYNQFFALSQNAIAQFWKNRLTLVKLGRLYCKNIFKNLPAAANSIKFENLEKTVNRPILVLGAGESLEQIAVSRSREQGKGTGVRGQETQGFYIIAVDAALSSLLAAGIVPDAVVASEAQIAIEKAYIGTRQLIIENGELTINRNRKPILFCDLTSRHTIPRLGCFEPCFFFSEFEKNNFTARLKKTGILPRALPPLGSVGISAAYIATLLRANDDVPIYVGGLDFSFSLGKTHANGTMAHKARLLANSRLAPLANYGAAFSLGAEKIIGKNGEPIFTTKNLLGYAELFKNFFVGTKNVFDCGTGGIDLGIQATLTGSSSRQQVQGGGNNGKESERTAMMPCGCGTPNGAEGTSSTSYGCMNNSGIVRAFLEEERAALLALADILTNGENAKSRDKTIAYNEQILRLLEYREYLFLHFPDGATTSLESSFLKRVRTQIDFFLKEIDCSLEKIV